MVLPRKMKRDFVNQQIVESVLNNWEALSKIIQLDLGKAGLDGKSGKIKNVEFRRLMFLLIGFRNNFGARGEKKRGNSIGDSNFSHRCGAGTFNLFSLPGLSGHYHSAACYVIGGHFIWWSFAAELYRDIYDVCC